MTTPSAKRKSKAGKIDKKKATSLPSLLEDSVVVDPRKQPGEKQNVYDARIKKEIAAATMFDPDETWVFDYDEIPKNKNISDFVLGCLETGSHPKNNHIRKRVSKAQLKNLPYVYTAGGYLTDRRKGGGRPFSDMDRDAVALSTGEYLLGAGSYKAKKGKLTTATIFDADGSEALLEKIFRGEDADPRSSKRQKVTPTKNTPQDQDESDEGFNDILDAEITFVTTEREKLLDAQQKELKKSLDASEKLATELASLRAQVASHENMVETMTASYKSEIADLKTSHAATTKSLKEDIEARKKDEAENHALILSQIQRGAKALTENISESIFQGIQLAEPLANKSEKLAKVVLWIFKKNLQKNLQLVQDQVDIHNQLQEITTVPGGPLDKFARATVSQQDKASLQKDLDEILADIDKHEARLRQEAGALWLKQNRDQVISTFRKEQGAQLEADLLQDLEARNLRATRKRQDFIRNVGDQMEKKRPDLLTEDQAPTYEECLEFVKIPRYRIQRSYVENVILKQEENANLTHAEKLNVGCKWLDALFWMQSKASDDSPDTDFIACAQAMLDDAGESYGDDLSYDVPQREAEDPLVGMQMAWEISDSVADSDDENDDDSKDEIEDAPGSEEVAPGSGSEDEDTAGSGEEDDAGSDDEDDDEDGSASQKAGSDSGGEDEEEEDEEA